MADDRPKIRSDRKQRLQARVLQTMERSVKSARIAILVVAVLAGLSALIPYSEYIREVALQREIALRDPAGNVGAPDLEMMRKVVIVKAVFSLIVAAVFVGLFFLAKKKPVGATVTALVIYLGMCALTVLMTPSAYLLGVPLIKDVLILAALVYGIKAALRYSRAKEQQAPEAQPTAVSEDAEQKGEINE